MKITRDINLTDFNFWSGARTNAELLTEDELTQIEFILDEVYPDGLDEVELNDIMWFDFDWIAECLDTTWDMLMERNR